MTIVATLLQAAGLFLVTNIDDIIVLSLFFARGVGQRGVLDAVVVHKSADGTVTELILATDPNLEGEATATYLARMVKPMGLRVTRLASGLPVGGDLEYADEVTLGRAFEGRRLLDV